LSKATEYIRHLEMRNKALLNENRTMQARIAAFEKFLVAGALDESVPQQPPMLMQHRHDGYSHVVNLPMPSDDNLAPLGVSPLPEHAAQRHRPDSV
jgi:hypothetical protein